MRKLASVVKMAIDKPEWKKEAERNRESLPEYYTATEMSRLLGYNSPAYITKLCQAGTIMAFSIGRCRLIPDHEVERWAKQKVDRMEERLSQTRQWLEERHIGSR